MRLSIIPEHGRKLATTLRRMRAEIARRLARREVARDRPLEPPWRRFPVTGPLTASEALEEDRAER